MAKLIDNNFKGKTIEQQKSKEKSGKQFFVSFVDHEFGHCSLLFNLFFINSSIHVSLRIFLRNIFERIQHIGKQI
jgi:hypothetical protein